jgi:hypothetical protein
MCPSDRDAGLALQAKLDKKSREAEIIRGEIQMAKLQAQMMRLQLQVRGVNDTSLIPADMGTGGVAVPPRASDIKWSEHKRLLEWLAENCDLTSKQAYNVPDPEVNVGGHRALLGRMAQWRLNVPGGLRLSAPLEAERELIDILMKTRSDLLPAEKLEEFADDWLLVTTDLVADNIATPALVLIHKESSKAMVVSAWPNISEQPPALVPQALFDPATFFNRALPQGPMALPAPTSVPCIPGMEVAFVGTDAAVSRIQCSAEGGMMWLMDSRAGEVQSRPVEELGVSFDLNEQFTLAGPFGKVDIADPTPEYQRWLVVGLVALALEHGVRVQRNTTPAQTRPSRGEARKAANDDVGSDAIRRRLSWSAGDQVEVKYKGSWLKGVLQAVQGDVAHVKCDVDDKGVITVAPLDRVRSVDGIEQGAPAVGFNIEGPEADLAEGFGQC